MSENKRFTTWGNRIKRNDKLLNINFETKTDAKLCCKLFNQMDKDNQEYIDKLDEIFKWYKEYYGETILDTKMGWNEDNKISKLKKENEQLKQAYQTLKHRHSLLHDVCIEAECDRDRYHKDVVSLEKENEMLKEENQELRHFKLSIKSFAECNENINSRTLNDLIELIDYD